MMNNANTDDRRAEKRRVSRFMKSAPFVLLVCVILAQLAGCGASEGPQRVIVQGKVTFEGQPVANGQILFYPTGDTRGPVSGGPIKDGQYIAKARGGVPIGTHRVEITAFRAPTGSGGFAITEGTPAQQYLPAKFNENTELSAVVDENSDPAIKDFNLTIKQSEYVSK